MADGGGFKGNDPALAARQRQMEKQRVKMMADFANERERIARDSQVNVGSDKFVSQALDVEAELKRDTVGLVHLDEFQRIRGQLEEEKKRKEEEAAAASRKARIGGVAVKQKKKSMLQKGKLSFDDDLDGDDGNGFNNGNGDLDDGAMPAKKRRLKKDPTVDTSFLPDKDREEKERALRESLKQEWIDQQEAIKKEEIRVDVSYWDGSGHAGSVVCMKGDKIGHMLQKAKELYPQISRTAVDNLVFIKEDTILPHHYTFYDFIVNRVRGVCGPLYTWQKANDVRTASDLTNDDKETSYSAKIVEKSWYERHKHIFPSNKWQVYDPNKKYGQRDVTDSSKN